MLSKRSFGIAGAAMLGSVALLGTNAANASVNLDMLDKSDPAATFAQETVTMEVDSDVGGTYYQVSDSGAVTVLDIHGEIGVGSAQDETIIITYTLTGMVWGADLSAASLLLFPADTEVDAALPTGNTAAGAGETALVTGGMEGENTAVFHLSENDEATIAQDQILYLDVASLGVSTGGGSVNVHVRHEQGEESSSGYTNAVTLARGVREIASAMNPVTEVVRGYQDFGLHDADGNATTPDVPQYRATVGSFRIGVQHRNAADGAVATMENVFGATAIGAVGTATERTAAMADAMVQFEGSMGFADHVWLDTTMSCAATDVGDTGGTRDLVERDTDGNNNGKMLPVALGEFGTTNAMADAKYLCIEVPGGGTEDNIAIPATGAFNGKSTYAGIEDAMIPPMGMDTPLGRIVRDGVNVWLPYLTLDPRYRQRIMMVNNSDSAAAYRMEFVSEDGITVTAGAASSGMLAANSTTVLHLLHDDVMSIAGGPPNRSAAMLIIEAERGDISVATNQTNFSTGGTDTVVYDEELTN